MFTNNQGNYLNKSEGVVAMLSAILILAALPWLDTSKIKSLRRQLSIVQDLNKLDLDFESIVTHNVSNTMQVLSDHSKSDWLVLSWDGRISNGFLINNPLGWIVSNINSNFALFKDNGVRYIRKVVLAVRPRLP